ncbi:Xanthine dehydrogenase accessory protein XdhC [Sulfitobacter noctilucae]|uniref:xanthine dehydrogenase accessory protein XdhC n=1 Tax=Sulfitobacter noctilucae TaxID=1342302 RepID=UPI00046B0794|nr:xanthine dehydrogenase accessory protein XdhC [Sulfitobacter noctilucae]KIN60042.1 Xanthine dehydrogenase accessory protein XdhC [Sulfitobacter noctilucae]
MSAIWIEITGTRGSAPRDTGTAMKVTAGSTEGTIGGGALEYAAIATARTMLEKGETARTETLPLGPNLGQCCGGVVSLRYTDAPRDTDPSTTPVWQPKIEPQVRTPLWLWGAGHVGRAVVRTAPPEVFDIHWIDSAADRFPAHVDDYVTCTPATDMTRLARHAAPGAHHLIFTYSHDIDLALCAALLKRDATSIGLIGSATKAARFRKRLTESGLDPAAITCPIGDKSLGKRPDQIAKGTVNALLAQIERKAAA